MKKIFTLLAILSFISVQSQNENLNKITTTITNYFDGYIYRDIKKLNLAFDTEQGTMKVPVIEDEKIIGFKNRYFKELVVKWGNRKKMSKKELNNCALKILNIDIVDEKIASAKISMKVDTVTYIDILSLNKVKSDWKITNKTYVVRK